MAAERKTIQELIEEGRSTTESLLSHANYAEAMICSRKTLETLVQSLCRRNNLPIGDLTDMLDNLYREGVISKDGFAGVLKISMRGERAQSEGQNDPALASESFELLSQAVYAYRQMLEHQSSARRRSASRRPARRRTSGGISLDNLPPYVKIGVPLVVILLLIFLVRSFASHRKAADPTVNASVESSESSAEAALTTEAETSAVAPSSITVYTTSTSLNVRETPSTSGKLLTTLPAGTVLDYVGSYNDQWTIINYNGTQAYVATQYVTASEVNPAERGNASATRSSSQTDAAETEPALGSTASGTTAADETSAQKAQSSSAKSSTSSTR